MDGPVDTIIGSIGVKSGFQLKGIQRIRGIRKRKTKYSGSIIFLRESLVKLEKD